MAIQAPVDSGRVAAGRPPNRERGGGRARRGSDDGGNGRAGAEGRWGERDHGDARACAARSPARRRQSRAGEHDQRANVARGVEAGEGGRLGGGFRAGRRGQRGLRGAGEVSTRRPTGSGGGAWEGSRSRPRRNSMPRRSRGSTGERTPFTWGRGMRRVRSWFGPICGASAGRSWPSSTATWFRPRNTRATWA